MVARSYVGESCDHSPTVYSSNVTITYMSYANEPVWLELFSVRGDRDNGAYTDNLNGYWTLDGRPIMEMYNTKYMADAFLLYRGASGQVTLTAEQQQRGDMDKSGTINMADAFALYRQVSGMSE